MLVSEQNPSREIRDLVNQARLVLGMPPLRKLLKGIPDTARKCVLGRSLGCDVLIDDQERAYALLLRYRAACSLARVWGVARPYGVWNGWAVLLPSSLNEFVHDFDSRCYPSMESPQRDSRGDLKSELRSLRFDWTDQHTRVKNLLEQAGLACDNAEWARNQLAQSKSDVSTR
jgi:hypothetical protein